MEKENEHDGGRKEEITTESDEVAERRKKSEEIELKDGDEKQKSKAREQLEKKTGISKRTTMDDDDEDDLLNHWHRWENDDDGFKKGFRQYGCINFPEKMNSGRPAQNDFKRLRLQRVREEELSRHAGNSTGKAPATTRWKTPKPRCCWRC